LIISSIVLFAIGQREATSLNNAVIAQQQIKVLPQVLDASEIMTAKFVIEAIAAKHAMPVSVNIENAAIVITGDKTAIQNYNRMMGFLSSLRGLPYYLEYKELCIGNGCGQPFSVVLEVKK
jgi:hypothetical protein